MLMFSCLRETKFEVQNESGMLSHLFNGHSSLVSSINWAQDYFKKSFVLEDLSSPKFSHLYFCLLTEPPKSGVRLPVLENNYAQFFFL